MTKKEINELISEFKKLVIADVSGITVTDARETVNDWLIKLGEYNLANYFNESVWDYQNSKKITKMINKYQGWED